MAFERRLYTICLNLLRPQHNTPTTVREGEEKMEIKKKILSRSLEITQ
jgi:hypothetical protein